MNISCVLIFVFEYITDGIYSSFTKSSKTVLFYGDLVLSTFRDFVMHPILKLLSYGFVTRYGRAETTVV